MSFAGHKLNLWDSYGLGQYELRAGSFSEDSCGRWYLNVAVKVQTVVSTGTAMSGHTPWAHQSMMTCSAW